MGYKNGTPAGVVSTEPAPLNPFSVIGADRICESVYSSRNPLDASAHGGSMVEDSRTHRQQQCITIDCTFRACGAWRRLRVALWILR